MGKLDAAIYSRGVVKSVQRGSFTFFNATTGTITLSQPVNPNKAVVVVSCKSATNTYVGIGAVAGCELQDEQTLYYEIPVMIATQGYNNLGTCFWQVIEFY